MSILYYSIAGQAGPTVVPPPFPATPPAVPASFDPRAVATSATGQNLYAVPGQPGRTTTVAPPLYSQAPPLYTPVGGPAQVPPTPTPFPVPAPTPTPGPSEPGIGPQPESPFVPTSATSPLESVLQPGGVIAGGEEQGAGAPVVAPSGGGSIGGGGGTPGRFSGLGTLTSGLAGASFSFSTVLPTSDEEKARKSQIISNLQYSPFGDIARGSLQFGALTPGQAEVAGAQPSFGGPAIAPPDVPSALDYGAGAGAPSDMRASDTQNQFDNKVSTAYSNNQSAANDISRSYTQGLVSDAAIKYLSDNSLQLFGAQHSPASVRNLLNTSSDMRLSTATGPKTLAQLAGDLNAQFADTFIDPVTGNAYNQGSFDIDYTGEDNKYQSELDSLRAQIDTLSTKDPLAGETLVQAKDRLIKETGLASLRTQRDAKQEELDILLSTYEGIAEEIKNDPDFSKRLKGRRLEYLSDKQSIAVTVVERALSRLNTQISDQEKDVNNTLNLWINDYNIYDKRLTQLTNAYDKLQGRVDDQADNARSAFNTLIQNPELAKDITDLEIAFIQKNGYYPTSLIKKVGTETGYDFKSIIQTNPTANTTQVFGITKDGQMVPIGEPVTDIRTTSGGPGTTTTFQDIGGRRTMITYDQSGNILKSEDIGQAGEKTSVETRQDFINWLPTVTELYTGDQLRNVASTFVPTLDPDKDTAISSAIDDYQAPRTGLLGIMGRKAQTDIDPIQAFDAYQQSPTASPATKLYTVKSPDGRSTLMYITDDIAQQYKQKGYGVVPAQS